MTHYAPIIAAFVTLILGVMLTLSKVGTIQDIPNERSLHDEPIPRTGGIALMAGILSGWMMLIQSWAWWIVLPALGLFELSLLDDVRNLSPRTRLIGHFVAALIVVGWSGVAWLWSLPVLLFIVWMTNLYNFTRRISSTDKCVGREDVAGWPAPSCGSTQRTVSETDPWLYAAT